MMQYNSPRKLAPNSPVRPQLQLLDNGAYCLPQKQNLPFLNFLCCEGWPDDTIQGHDKPNVEGFQYSAWKYGLCRQNVWIHCHLGFKQLWQLTYPLFLGANN